MDGGGGKLGIEGPEEEQQQQFQKAAKKKQQQVNEPSREREIGQSRNRRATAALMHDTLPCMHGLRNRSLFSGLLFPRSLPCVGCVPASVLTRLHPPRRVSSHPVSPFVGAGEQAVAAVDGATRTEPTRRRGASAARRASFRGRQGGEKKKKLSARRMEASLAGMSALSANQAAAAPNIADWPGV